MVRNSEKIMCIIIHTQYEYTQTVYICDLCLGCMPSVDIYLRTRFSTCIAQLLLLILFLHLADAEKLAI